MTTPPNVKQHGDTPPNLGVPVHRHSSETARSSNDAGGPVLPAPHPGDNAPVRP